MTFTREDWTLFRSLNTLPQKAGVPLGKLAPLVLKELADNALDVGANVKVTPEANGWFSIEDDGPGIDPAKVATLYSIRRPLTSSKLLRLPQRGALGNGLRVVMGAVYASGGSIQIETQGQGFNLLPQDDGTTIAEPMRCSWGAGTRIRVKLGDAIPNQRTATYWTAWSELFAHRGKTYKGKTSAWWYDEESFFEMLHAAGDTPLSDLLALFDGVDARKARVMASSSSFVTCEGASKADARILLLELRTATKKPTPASLGEVGPLHRRSYAKKTGEIQAGSGDVRAHIPFVVEAYVDRLQDIHEGVTETTKDEVYVMVNRTRVTGDMYVNRDGKTKMSMYGMGLNHWFKVPKDVPLRIVISVTIPYMPITTDGKDPDLGRMFVEINEAVEKAARAFKKETEKALRGDTQTQQAVILTNLRAAIRKASGEGRYRFSLRQLYYAVRPYVLDAFPDIKEFDYNYFGKVITDYETSLGEDVPGMYRSVRGVLHIPHTHEKLPLGTKEVEQYQHRKWNFNKVVYIEKEGFISLLLDEGWLDRNDCAMLTCQGFANRAARDVIDLLGEKGDEEIHFYCIHDADASGTKIYEALTEATKARPGRKVVVHDLGLNPDEALDMDLQVETFTKKNPNAKYPVGRRYRWTEWEDWLQGHRVELNAMDSPTFLAWLDMKFKDEPGKVIPPDETLVETFREEAETAIREKLTEKILKEAKLDEQVEERTKLLPEDLNLHATVTEGLEQSPKYRWDRPLKDLADFEAQSIVYGDKDDAETEGVDFEVGQTE